MSRALEIRAPRVMGFSNYSWNCNLSYEYTRRVKEKYPETIVIFDGPNYEIRPEETSEFWRQYPLVDFYVVKESELAFLELFRTFQQYDFDVSKLKNNGVVPANCRYPYEGPLREGEFLPRVNSLEQLPSPYQMGLKGHRSAEDLFITDVNFGMFNFNFVALAESHFCVDPNNYKLPAASEFSFRRTSHQNSSSMTLVSQYGNTQDARGKVLIRSDAAKLFRNPIRPIAKAE